MGLTGVAIMPHGTLAFDGNPDSFSPDCRERYTKLPLELARKFTEVYTGCCKVAEDVAKMEPDLIILNTVHGIGLSKSMGVCLNTTAEGNALWNGCWEEFKVSLELDSETAKNLLSHFQNDGIAAEGILAFSGASMPLRWGEVVPCWYILSKLKKVPKFIYLSQSRQPLNGLDETRISIGESLARFVNGLQNVKVLLLISGDLSHTYSTACMDPLYALSIRSLPVNNEKAVYFERAILGWVKCVRDTRLLDNDGKLPEAVDIWEPDTARECLRLAAETQEQALSCGIFGFIMSHGFMETMMQLDSSVSFQPYIGVCQAPTYYGMMAALFANIGRPT